MKEQEILPRMMRAIGLRTRQVGPDGLEVSCCRCGARRVSFPDGEVARFAGIRSCNCTVAGEVKKK